LGRACEQADELAGEPGVSPARSLIEEAGLLSGRTAQAARTSARVGRAGVADPAVGAPLAAGRLPVAKADAMLRAANRVEEPGGRGRVIALGTGLSAVGATLPALRDECEKFAARLDPGGFSRAHDAAYRDRDVSLQWQAAGMAIVRIYGAHDELAPVFERLCSVARARVKAARVAAQAEAEAAAEAKALAAAEAEVAAAAAAAATAAAAGGQAAGGDSEAGGAAGGDLSAGEAEGEGEDGAGEEPKGADPRATALARHDWLGRALAGAALGADAAGGDPRPGLRRAASASGAAARVTTRG
jgi:SWI/SNF-related matrix-associated actin-dependent regulator 1 of chromatin subfamily A